MPYPAFDPNPRPLKQTTGIDPTPSSGEFDPPFAEAFPELATTEDWAELHAINGTVPPPNPGHDDDPETGKDSAGATPQPLNADTEEPESVAAGDIAYADQLAQHFKGTLRYCPETDRWLRFNPDAGWLPDLHNLRLTSVLAWSRAHYAWALQAAKSLSEQKASALLQSAAGTGSLRKINSALTLLACDPRVMTPLASLDADPWLLGCQNGVLNLRTATFQPHHIYQLVTRRVACAFDASAQCPQFLAFLARVQPAEDMRRMLQQLAGYTLTGVIREHILPFHYGLGANGKGTFLEQTLLKLLGNYARKLNENLVMHRANPQGRDLSVAELQGCRFALGEESAEGGRLNEEFLKASSGGDRLKGRRLYLSEQEFPPSHKTHLVGNHKPNIMTTTNGIWRRFIIIPWDIIIPNEEMTGDLPDILATEFPGILNWCLAGCRDWQANRLFIPESCRLATEDFREDSDTFADFIDLNFDPFPGCFLLHSEVFDAYLKWAKLNGISDRDLLDAIRLSGKLAKRGWQRDHKRDKKKARGWNGWMLKPSSAASSATEENRSRYTD